MEVDVFLAAPNSGQIHPSLIRSVGGASLPRSVEGGRGLRVLPYAETLSALAWNFNRAWVAALNLSPRPKYFAMIHSDVIAPPGWLDTMFGLLQSENLDVISAVIPLRNTSGETSTALLVDSGSVAPGEEYRRLTMREAFGPESLGSSLFYARDLVRMFDPFEPEAPRLLLNTGLWLCRLGDWAEKVAFHQQDRIRRNGPVFHADFWPEDWDFSEQLAALNLRTAATIAVRVAHGDERCGYGRLWGAEHGEWHAKPAGFSVGPYGVRP